MPQDSWPEQRLASISTAMVKCSRYSSHVVVHVEVGILEASVQPLRRLSTILARLVRCHAWDSQSMLSSAETRMMPCLAVCQDLHYSAGINWIQEGDSFPLNDGRSRSLPGMAWPSHFSGNFWWASAAFWHRLPDGFIGALAYHLLPRAFALPADTCAIALPAVICTPERSQLEPL